MRSRAGAGACGAADGRGGGQLRKDLAGAEGVMAKVLPRAPTLLAWLGTLHFVLFLCPFHLSLLSS